MSNDDLIKRGDALRAVHDVMFGWEGEDIANAVEAINAIQAKQSARIAELEAQLARYEAVAYIIRNETGQISIKDINDNAFDILKRVGTKLFALKDEK